MRRKTPISWLLCLALVVIALFYLQTDRSRGSAEGAGEAPLAHYKAAKAAHAQRNVQEALRESRLFLNAASGDLSADSLRRQAEAALFVIRNEREGEGPALLRDIAQRLAHDPTLLADFYFHVSDFYENAGRLDQAKLYITQAVNLLKDHATAPKELNKYYDTQLRMARVLEKSGDLNGAIDVLQKVTSSHDPRWLRQRLHGIFRLANLYFRVNRSDEARHLFQSAEHALGSTPAALAFYYRLYHFYAIYKQSGDAERYYQKCLELGSRLPSLKSLKDPTDEDPASYRQLFLAHFFLAKLLQDRQEVARSIHHFEQLLQDSPPDRLPFRWGQSASALLLLYEKSYASQESIDTFIQQTLPRMEKRALALFLHHVVGYYERKKQAREMKAMALRLENLITQQSWGFDPQMTRLKFINDFRIAGLLAAEGHRQSAGEHYQRMLEAPPYGPYFFKCQMESAFKLVDLYRQTGRAAEVDNVFHAASSKADDYLRSSAARSHLQYERHKLELLKIAVDFNYRAAQYYDKLGQKKAAQQYLQNVLQLKAGK